MGFYLGKSVAHNKFYVRKSVKMTVRRKAASVSCRDALTTSRTECDVTCRLGLRQASSSIYLSLVLPRADK